MITIGGYGLLLGVNNMNWSVYVLIALWGFGTAMDLYVLIKKRKEDKANYRFLVCEQEGKSLVPIDCFNCETDARAHYAQQEDTVIVRMTSSDLDWFREHVSK